ncbi:hypothetical protein [Ulvibacter litoralis]|uniref:Uncharacterized protein n=1 Tax=Ulvibacter litoralis TaxID=227084 RepID=A0A1G7CEN8_9FLAO|nr:hypothetical protein [Ulvibacter litoralis]GHC47834.1 hypothetical protein GCM10008083_08850 [Ulvibacter litoralis]SDE37200.1 hypothetical protein SAMN05421855_101307 [Ulvibacter litoralis]
MILKPKILLYIITIVVVIAAIIWEVYMQKMIATLPENAEPIMRSDLFVIWPVVITLVSVSLFRIFGKKE